MKKIACLFPGIGYTCNKPLLYYSCKLLSSLNWEVVPVMYSGFPSGVKGNAKKMQQSAYMALDQAEEILKSVNWSDYSDILLIGKSVGTVVCTAYARRHRLLCRQVLFTPVEATFDFADSHSIVFHGTADPWAESKMVEKNCRQLNLPLYITENANHSLETGDIDFDIENLRNIIKTIRTFVLGKDKQCS